MMQFINLDTEENYSLELNKENLSDLVEDYKIKNEQFNWCYNELKLDDGCGYQLSYGTTQQSYYIDPEKKIIYLELIVIKEKKELQLFYMTLLVDKKIYWKFIVFQLHT